MNLWTAHPHCQCRRAFDPVLQRITGKGLFGPFHKQGLHWVEAEDWWEKETTSLNIVCECHTLSSAYLEEQSVISYFGIFEHKYIISSAERTFLISTTVHPSMVLHGPINWASSWSAQDPCTDLGLKPLKVGGTAVLNLESECSRFGTREEWCLHCHCCLNQLVQIKTCNLTSSGPSFFRRSRYCTIYPRDLSGRAT